MRVCRALALFFAACCLAFSGCASTVNEYLEEVKENPTDAEAVGEAVVEIGAILEERRASGEPLEAGDLEALEFLKQAARSHANFHVRMQAVAALSRAGLDGLEPLFREALDDPHWGVRWAALKALRRHPSREAVPKIAHILLNERRLELISDAVGALEAAGGPQALEALLEAFLSPDRRKYAPHRLKIYDALAKLSGRSYDYYDLESWAEYRRELKGESGGRKGPGETTPPAPETDPQAQGGRGKKPQRGAEGRPAEGTKGERGGSEAPGNGTAQPRETTSGSAPAP